jgi:hypothetical protein
VGYSTKKKRVTNYYIAQGKWTLENRKKEMDSPVFKFRYNDENVTGY